jgi:tetratricopeptide (TPR) repeat protein
LALLQGQQVEAARLLEEALARDPQSAWACSVRLELLALGERWEEGRQWAEVALERGVRSADLVFLHAVCLVQLGLPDQALERLEAALAGTLPQRVRDGALLLHAQLLLARAGTAERAGERADLLRQVRSDAEEVLRASGDRPALQEARRLLAVVEGS